MERSMSARESVEQMRARVGSQYGNQLYMLCEVRAYEAARQFALSLEPDVGVSPALEKKLGELFNGLMIDTLCAAIEVFGEKKIDPEFLARDV
jgi:hypothetical protein